MSGRADFVVRPAVTADADGITTVHLQGWREAYSEYMPESVFEAREASRPRRVEVWIEIIEGRSPFGKERAYVAEIDGRIVGWATASDGLDDDSPYPNQLDGLYVLKEAHGTGIGQALLEAAVGTGTGAYLWAIDSPTRAISFYRKMGFLPDGTKKQLLIDGADLMEQRLVRHPAS